MAFNALKFLPAVPAFHAREALAEHSCATTGSFIYMDFRHQLPASCSADAVFVPDFCNVTRITMHRFASRLSSAWNGGIHSGAKRNFHEQEQLCYGTIFFCNCAATRESIYGECMRLQGNLRRSRRQRMYISNHQVWLKVTGLSWRNEGSRKRKSTSAGTGSALRRARVAG
jgi:hypothetical protein